MNEKRTFTDAELTAWLDGEVEHAPVSQIEQALPNDPELRARVDDLRIDLDAMQASFDTLLVRAPDAPKLVSEIAAPKAQNSNRFRGLRALAATLALCLAGATGYLISDKKDNSWRGFVAAYQALYTEQTLARLGRPADELEAELVVVSGALGKPLNLGTMTAVGDLDYRRGQVLGFNGRPLVQLAFLSKSGDPVALCIIRSEDSAQMSTVLGAMEGMSSAAWASDGYEYLLIGGGDKTLIEQAAKVFSARI